MKRFKSWLRQRAQTPHNNLRLLLSGTGLFFSGVGSLTIAQYVLPPSLKAELVALAGLILMTAGSILALIGYLSLSVLRIWHFLDEDDEQHRDPPPRH